MVNGGWTREDVWSYWSCCNCTSPNLPRCLASTLEDRMGKLNQNCNCHIGICLSAVPRLDLWLRISWMTDWDLAMFHPANALIFPLHPPVGLKKHHLSLSNRRCSCSNSSLVVAALPPPTNRVRPSGTLWLCIKSAVLHSQVSTGNHRRLETTRFWLWFRQKYTCVLLGDLTSPLIGSDWYVRLSRC